MSQKEINEWKTTRLRQLDAKAAMMKAENHYNRVKAKAYLDTEEKAHFKSERMATLVPNVIEAKEAKDKATIEHDRWWIEASFLSMTMGNTLDKKNESIVELDNDES